MKLTHSLLATATLSVAAASLQAQSAAITDPAVTTWRRNLDGTTGRGGTAAIQNLVGSILADIERTSYTGANVYVEGAGIPSHVIGPWSGNPNLPTDRNWSFRIPRVPVPATGTHTPTPLGPIGVFVNGVPAYNAKDAHSWQNQGFWNQNAMYWEGLGFDTGKGHPSPDGTYHYHQQPALLLAQRGDNAIDHSTIIGFAFDGFPIYGPHGFANTDGTGGIARIRTSYRLRAITARTTLPDGTVLAPAQYGPAINATYPLGAYIEDFEYVAGLGDLDVYNGRFAVTPEYPSGTYAYSATIDAGGAPAYPYIVGPRYYGVLDNGNTGMGGGHIAIPGGATQYAAFSLYSTDFQNGGAAHVSGGDAAANASSMIAYWFTHGGPHVYPFGTLERSIPIYRLGTFQADASGRFTTTFPLTSALIGVTIHLQGVQLGPPRVFSAVERVLVLP